MIGGHTKKSSRKKGNEERRSVRGKTGKKEKTEKKAHPKSKRDF